MATRRERVILELRDSFTTEMARAAAATALLNKELGGLSRESVQTRQSTRAIGRDVEALGRTSNRAERDIDRLSGRLRILADIGAALGPGLVPITAVAIPAITGLAASLGFAAVGTGVLITAFRGVGEALKDLDKAALDPTAENLEKAQESLDALSPAARDFTEQLRALRPALNDVQELAAQGVLPGFADGLEAAVTRLPDLARIVDGFSTSLGNIGENLGQAIGDGRVDEFLAFVAVEGPQVLEEFATIIGQTTLGLANMWMAFTPLNNDFSDFLVESTADFERWSAELSQTEGFQNFVDYIRENGPVVADALGSVGGALVQIVQAISPIGGPSLQILESLADTLSAIADSDLGTPIFGLVAALGLLNTTYRITQTFQLATFGGPAVARLRGYASSVDLVTSAQQRATMSSRDLAAAEAARTRSLKVGAASLAGLAFVGTGAADSMGLANTATLALAGSLAGPYGVAIGAAIGLTQDLGAAFGDTGRNMERYIELLLVGTDAPAARLAVVTEELKRQREILDGRTLGADGTLQTVTFGLYRADPEGDKALENVKALESVQEELRHQVELGTAANYQNARSAENSAGANAEATAQLTRLRDEAGKNAAGFLGFDKTLNESTITLGTWITHLNKQATALENFASNAETVTRRGLSEGLVKQLAEAGPEGALRLKQLADAGDAEIARANRAFERGQAGIKQYQDVADGLEPIVLDVAIDKADEKLKRMETILDRLGIGVTVPVKVTFEKGQGPLTPLVASGLIQTPADGGTIHPIRRAYGGTVPGVRWPYYDKVPMLAAPGEEVISNRFGQADKNRGALKAANAGATLGVVGYADGGEVQPFRPYASVSGGSMSPGGPAIDYDRLAISMGQLRPVHGDVYMQPHNYGEFQREMEADRQRASLDGIQR